MKIKFAPLGSKALTTTLAGAYLRDTKHGPVVQSRPTHNKGLKTAIARAWQTRFGFAARMASSATYLDYQTAVEMAKGTEQVPRDILTMAALGRYYVFENEDGFQWGHVEGPTAFDRQELGETMWEWSQHDAAWTATMEATARATKGVIFTPPFNDKFYSVRTVFTGVAGGTYRVAWGRTTAGNVIDQITLSNPKVITSNGLQVAQFMIEGTLQANFKNFFTLTRTDLTAAYALPINANQTQRWQFPLINQGFITLLSNAPAIGNTFTIAAAANAPPFGFLVKQ